ncbi:MAG: ATP-binding protein [Treponemataceae bacterium]
MFVSLVYSSYKIQKATTNFHLAGEIHSTLMERLILRDEYFIRNEASTKTQLIAKTEILMSQLKQAQSFFHSPDDIEILSEMIREETRTGIIYEKIMRDDLSPISDNADKNLVADQKKALFSQLLIKTNNLTEDAHQLEKNRYDTLLSIKRTSEWLLGGSLVFIVLLILTNGFFIEMILTRKIQRLQSGMAIIGAGKLDYRFADISIDEIADVARGINQMAASLEVSNKELESFAYSVAHDLRAPLRSIDGFARILQEEYANNLDAEGQRLFGVIRSSAVRLDNLINDLLEITRIGKTELTLSVVDMRAAAIESFQLCDDPAVLSGFDLKVGPLPSAMADRMLISSVWSNLLSNAVKYSRPSPVHKIELESFAKNGMNVYSVRDQGIGFDPRYADKLFGMFQRLHGSENFQGTGIGLAIVKKIIDRHGGETWAESRPKMGEPFFIFHYL